MRTKELREQRAKLLSDQRALLGKVEAEKRVALTDDEKAQIVKMQADYKSAGEELRLLEELEAEERAARETVPPSQRTTTKTDEAPTYEQAMDSYLRYGTAGMKPEERAVLAPRFQTFGPEERALATLTGSGGGFTIAPDTSFYGRVMEAAKAWGGMFRAGCQEINSSTGADLPISTNDDTANVAVIVGESSSHASGTDPVFAQVNIRAHMYTTKIIKVSWQLLQDSGFNIEAFLGRAFGTRLGRGQNAHLTTGTGAGQPQGAVTGSTQGRQSATGNATSVAADDVFRLFHAVNEAYRGPAKFMFSDATALVYRLLKDGEGRYLLGGLTDGQPMSLLGKPVIINDDMPTMAASAKHTLFGDFGNYIIRRVTGITVVRLNELYVENGQVGFVAFQRLDGALVDAGQHPLQHLANSAS